MHTLPVPEIGPDEVLIRVESAGVAEWDPFEREGGFAEDVEDARRSFLTCSAPTERGRSRQSASRSRASRKATGSTPLRSRTRRVASMPSTPR